jgi:branched-chain amino acid transport system substrate-binding protein
MARSSSDKPWTVGVLFSQTGATSIVEKSQLKGTLLAIDEINQAGGIEGRDISPVCQPKHEPTDFELT